MATGKTGSAVRHGFGGYSHDAACAQKRSGRLRFLHPVGSVQAVHARLLQLVAANHRPGKIHNAAHHPERPPHCTSRAATFARRYVHILSRGYVHRLGLSPVTFTPHLPKKHETLNLSSVAGIKVYPQQFRHPLTGSPLPDSAIFVDETDPGYPNKVVRKIKTPRVLQLARQQFGCPSLTGVALEDSEMVCTSNAHSLTPNLQAPRNSRAHPHANDYCNTHHQGAGSHWEARLLGSEILSYGMNSGKSPRTLQQPDSKARVGPHPEPERASPFTRFHRRGVPQQPHLGLLRRHQSVSGQLQHGRAFTRGVRLHG